jgi:predicted AAA+ superfamily ATPase
MVNHDTDLQRDLSSLLLEALENLPVVVLTGMRQTGKSTLLRTAAGLAGRRYVTLDDYAQLQSARTDPEGFLDGDDPITIDEVQRAPELLVAIKRAVDKKRTAGRFLLSGSADLSLLQGVTETLAGRAVYLTLRPFSLREKRGLTGEPAFLPRFFSAPKLPRAKELTAITPAEILAGGLPPVALRQVRNQSLWFRGFVQTYLERDIRDLAQIPDLAAFRRFLQLAALRTGQVLNLSELGRDAQLPASTATRWLSLLETSFAIARLPPFLGNRASRLIKAPKLYSGDAGLAAHLAGVDDLSPGADEPMRGALFETWAGHNLGSILEAHLPDAKLAYWNIQGRHEVDFVIESGRDCLAIEIRAASRWGERDLSGLKAFLEATPRCRAAVLAYNGTDAVKLGERLWAIPLSLLLT